MSFIISKSGMVLVQTIRLTAQGHFFYAIGPLYYDLFIIHDIRKAFYRIKVQIKKARWFSGYKNPSTLRICEFGLFSGLFIDLIVHFSTACLTQVGI